jgi:hypothetical protein
MLGEVGFAVIIKKDGPIDVVIVHINGFGPGPGGVLGLDHKITAAAHISTGKIKGPLPITDRRRVESPVIRSTLQGQLAGPVEGVADLFPMHKVAAVVNGEAREKLKGGVHEVKIIPHAADAGVRVETGKDGIAESFHVLIS